jgi:hypothetical protein
VKSKDRGLGEVRAASSSVCRATGGEGEGGVEVHGCRCVSEGRVGGGGGVIDRVDKKDECSKRREDEGRGWEEGGRWKG